MGRPAISAAPVSFTDPMTGNYISIPLSALHYDGAQITGEGNPYLDHKDAADALLRHYAKTGYIVAGAAPRRKPALILRAKYAGTGGNSIQVEFHDFDATDPQAPKFKGTATESKTYSGLALTTVEQVLGTTSGAGLVYLKAIPTLAPVPGVYQLAGDPASADLSAGFTVKARAAGPDGKLTRVEVKSGGNNTFTLVVTWRKTTDLLGPGGLGAALAYVLTVEEPEAGGSLGVPGPGVAAPNGGSDATPASKASTVVFD